MWAFYSTVNLHSPTVFHIFKFLSLPPLAICLLSGEKATAKTSLEWLTNLLLVVPFLISHNLRVPSHDDDKQYLLSWESYKSEMKWEWPLRVFLGAPHSFSSSVSFLSIISQIMIVLSLDPEIRNSLVSSPIVSSPTYKLVTQPPCPIRLDVIYMYGIGWKKFTLKITSVFKFILCATAFHLWRKWSLSTN